MAHAALNPDDFLSHMRDVQRCEASLRELNLMWRVIEAGAKMNCPEEARSILPMMAATRQGFQRLERDLVASLVQEKVANVMGEVGTRARHVIDLLVRNLYERTADVGFLASDRVLAEHLAGLTDDRDRVERRLRAYRDKYTVYDEVLLLSPDGEVMAQMDDAGERLSHSTDPVLADALSSDRHVERFGHTDLRPGRGDALVYAQRVCHPQHGGVVGVLCLVFGFDTEMAGIFASRGDAEGRSILLLLDGDDRVIASADEAWIGRGTRVPVNRDNQPRLCLHGGREYLVTTCAAQPYQGYPGPAGWQGQVMIPVDVAFHGELGGVLKTLAPQLADGLLSHARSFCPPLYEVVTEADAVRRVVWNGQVMTAGRGRDLHKLKCVLDQISETGARTDELFDAAIRDLYDTVLASKLSNAQSLSHLLVDLLDRNLYERANDCRWWARTPELRQALAEDAPATGETWSAVATILETINALYTVYSRLVVYDAEGRIVAASRPQLADGSSVVGRRIDAENLAAVLRLTDAQQYHVSRFGPCDLDDGRGTAVYHAAIRALDDERLVLGGIGIVFNATVELDAMLRSIESGAPGIQASYVDRQGRVLASTSPHIAPGSRLDIDAVGQLPRGASARSIIERDGCYALVSATVNAGYREFKTRDGNANDVIALTFQPLGALRDAGGARRRADTAIHDDPLHGGEEFATFFVGQALMALPAAAVREALPASQLAPVSLGQQPPRVGLLPRRRDGQVEGHVWVYDLHALLGNDAAARRGDGQVIVLEHAGIHFGLTVDELHGVPAFDAAAVIPAPRVQGGALVQRLVKANRGALLIQVLDVATIAAALGLDKGPQSEPAVPSPMAAAETAIRHALQAPAGLALA